MGPASYTRTSMMFEILGAMHPLSPSYLLGLDFGIEDENAATVLGWREHDPACTSSRATDEEGHG